MKPAEILERLLPRWRASLAPSYSAATIDGFIRRRRGELEDLVVQALAARKAEVGEEPETAVEFAAYNPIVDRERQHDGAGEQQRVRQQHGKRLEQVFLLADQAQLDGEGGGQVGAGALRPGRAAGGA